ncbi:MAG: aminoacyl-tRNA hydrolase [Faecalibacterium sp.]|nr:aminoacyl-tRNA hydrolase [Ruminococcus sp.]MCM1391198.1 aminoacyl-tRNA hydrolase [Ruminococcus sp.]MCM1485674.1 aminoacyl-tRNA hydrolase [Faecalibacterium sp.]
MIFKKNKTDTASTYDWLIVGLGNPGKKYEFTRHNAGFLFIDLFADKHGFKIDRLKFKSLITDARIGSHRCLFVKPQTFMNLSGEAVRDAAEFYKIPPERIIVIFDDISLEPGKMRIRRKGSAGGHNGIKNIIYHMKSEDFPRIKIGVGAKPHPDYDLADWVTSNFGKDELKQLRAACDNACDALELMLDGKIDEAMGKFNS